MVVLFIVQGGGAGEAHWVWWHENGSGSGGVKMAVVAVHGKKEQEMGARVVHAMRVRVVLGHIGKEEEQDSGWLQFMIRIRVRLE